MEGGSLPQWLRSFQRRLNPTIMSLWFIMGFFMETSKNEGIIPPPDKPLGCLPLPRLMGVTNVYVDIPGMIPSWLRPLIGAINNGTHGERVPVPNAFGLSPEGDLVLWMNVQAEEAQQFPGLGEIDSIWFIMEMDLFD